MFSRLAPKARSASRLASVPRRTYMSRAQYQAQVPDHVKEAVERQPPPTQKPGCGTCRLESNRARDQLQDTFTPPPAKVKQQSAPRWTEEHAQRVRDGYPAVVDGEGTATTTSEWHGGDHHAVAVVSPTKDGRAFVVHDPDTTHDPKTRAAHEAGRAEPRHNLRVMTQQELEKVSPRLIETEAFEPPTVVPAVEQGAPKKPWSAYFFGE